MSRLVAVSNRVSLPKRGVAPGGLAVGVLTAMKARGGLWFGWSGEIREDGMGPPEITNRGKLSFATVDLSPEDHELYYLGFCNGAIWPLFHYFLDAAHYHDPEHEAYLRVNRQFAERLYPLLEPGDEIWVHDYHLIPLARKLRELGAQQPIGFFLHIPFPHIEALRALPSHAELMRQLASFDLIGFQTRRDLDSFCSAVVEVFGAESMAPDGSITVCGRKLRLGVFPIGVDVEGAKAEAIQSRDKQSVQRMRRVAGLFGRKRLIGVDRLDYSKGLPERFAAFERFLEMFPEEQGEVSYIQIAPHSRTEVTAYAEIRHSLEQKAGRINGQFADVDWTPIRYLNRNFPHDVLMGFMRESQVALVTPLRDGMNLVAKEYVAAQDPGDPGVLILSTLAGAAEELTSAILVNPNDILGVARAIEEALRMPLAERRERHQQMMEVLRRNDIHAWHTRFLEVLAAAARDRS
jgi:trehalose 6-phosphate synthase